MSPYRGHKNVSPPARDRNEDRTGAHFQTTGVRWPMIAHDPAAYPPMPAHDGEDKRQTVCKPGSVRAACAAVDGHSSGTPFAERLTRPTRATGRKCPRVTRHVAMTRRRPPLFGLAPGGVYPARAVTGAAVRSYRTLSPLPAERLAPLHRRFAFCGTVPGVAPAGR